MEDIFRKVLRKTKYAKGQCLIYKHVNSLHVKLEIGLFIVYLIVSFIYLFKVENANIGIAVLTYFGAISLLRVWMEWKYSRETKEYILSIIDSLHLFYGFNVTLF